MKATDAVSDLVVDVERWAKAEAKRQIHLDGEVFVLGGSREYVDSYDVATQKLAATQQKWLAQQLMEARGARIIAEKNRRRLRAKDQRLMKGILKRARVRK